MTDKTKDDENDAILRRVKYNPLNTSFNVHHESVNSKHTNSMPQLFMTSDQMRADDHFVAQDFTPFSPN